jgi:predicted nucleotide-binding protein (sugar kinase/HSP70/actin superfamily)
MLVGVPHLGNLYLGLKAMARRLGGELIVPPACNQRTLSLGVKYSPEGLCIPFKLTLGNLIETAEMGADTILMVSGFGICRLGYYAKIQKQILHDLGYDVELVQFGISEKKLLGFLQVLRRLTNGESWPRIISAFRFGMAKLNTVDRIERRVQKVRAVEQVKGTANRLFTRAITDIDQADGYDALRRVQRDCLDQLDQVPRDTGVKPLVVGITGEFYVLLEPFSNLDVESELGKLGVEVRRRTFISEWVKYSLFLNPLGIDETRKIHKAAFPYLKRDVGGDGWESVGEKVLHAKEYDGIVHLAPFTCMPEIVAQNIMPSTRENIPVLTILCDEQLAKPGMLTRLEAFVDLLERKRRARSDRRQRAAV